jgi:hypothetical protein
MLTWTVFCFLWDDPVFNSKAPAPWLGDSLADEEFREVRRKARLTALQMLYIRIQVLEKDRDGWKEEAARGVWMWHKVFQHIPGEIAEQAMIDGSVAKDMDPDFSFLKAIAKTPRDLDDAPADGAGG